VTKTTRHSVEDGTNHQPPTTTKMGKIRVKARKPQERNFSPSSPLYEEEKLASLDLPQIGPDDDFKEIVRKLSM
jgi:hypothetical protein